jgi:hypothetical protein
MLDVASRLGADATLDKILAPEFLFAAVCRLLDDWNADGEQFNLGIHAS